MFKTNQHQTETNEFLFFLLRIYFLPGHSSGVHLCKPLWLKGKLSATQRSSISNFNFKIMLRLLKLNWYQPQLLVHETYLLFTAIQTNFDNINVRLMNMHYQQPITSRKHNKELCNRAYYLKIVKRDVAN
jgi:hypothetical protein